MSAGSEETAWTAETPPIGQKAVQKGPEQDSIGPEPSLTSPNLPIMAAVPKKNCHLHNTIL
jgi:hypothetical protein